MPFFLSFPQGICFSPHLCDLGETSAASAFVVASTTKPTLDPHRPHPRLRSLARGNTIVFVALAIATPMSGFPHIHANPLLALPALLCTVGLADTVRCMRKRWSWYHGAVLLCLYADLLALCLILFFLLYPYLVSIGEGVQH